MKIIKTLTIIFFIVVIAFVSLSMFKTEQIKPEVQTKSQQQKITEEVKTGNDKVIRTSFISHSDFRNEQKRYARVKNAYDEKEQSIKSRLAENNINIEELNILLEAYKIEQELVIYAKNASDTVYKKLYTYNICEKSGKPGPKRRQGDEQTPEGFYYIDEFNPMSNYYLSLGVSYPNQSDRIKSKSGNLGGDIFIHGDCRTIGCLPMTDDKIKEIYLMAVQARQSGQNKIPVYIFPFKMTAENSAKYNEIYKDNTALLDFWANLKTGFDKFESGQKELSFSIDTNGDYNF